MIFRSSQLGLSEDVIENILFYEDKEYTIDYFDESRRSVQGGNGAIFKLIDEQGEQEYVIKFLKFPYAMCTSGKNQKRWKRFEREIEALNVAKTNGLSGVIEIQFDGEHTIDNNLFRYYVMQKCDCNLRQYMAQANNELDIVQKTILCQKILAGIWGLHEYKIYHRDIKHENIFFVGDEPFVGDLGLADFRDSDIKIYERGELIGPTGWLSPEATNKMLVEKGVNSHGYDCIIDGRSEAFQLGKLFWYIYQGNLPLGQIIPEDFKVGRPELFDLLFGMLQYEKQRRFTPTQVASRISAFLSVN